MVKLIGKFSRLNRQKVLVAGDLLLDSYTIGKARRISPEAPVAVIHVQHQEERPGGAGNAILNLISMGAEVVALGRVGKDLAGEKLLKALKAEEVDISGIAIDPDFLTPVKNRIVADNQQVVRVDHESITPLSAKIEKQLIAKLPKLLKGVKVVAISDYGKGFFSATLLKALLQTAKKMGIFTIVDPKGQDFSRYSGASLLKPNLSEAYAAAHLPSTAPLEDAAKNILHSIDADYLMVTRSDAGISLFHRKNKREDYPVKAKQVKDVTGAGDTVLAMLTIAIANGLQLSEAIQLSNLAAGIAIEQFGCARVTLPQLAKRLLEADSTNKIFDAEHLHALKAALENTPCTLIQISAKNPLNSATIHALLQEKSKNGDAIVASIQGDPVSPEFLAHITSLAPIDFILLNTSQQAIRKHFPKIKEKQLAES